MEDRNLADRGWPLVDLQGQPEQRSRPHQRVHHLLFASIRRPKGPAEDSGMTARCRHDGGDGPCDLYPSGECRVRKRAYNASPAGKAAKAAYDASPARKAAQKVYDASPAGKAAKAANALRHHYGLTLEDKRALYEGQKGSGSALPQVQHDPWIHRRPPNP